MTEFLIALRDEASWLDEEDAESTLYPTGFSAAAFVKIITDEVIWRKFDSLRSHLTFPSHSAHVVN